MLEWLAAVVKEYLVPGSPSFLLLGLTVGVALLLGPRVARRAGTAMLVLLAALYWVLSVPTVAELLATRFHTAPVGVDPAPHRGHRDAIVVLGAGVITYALHGYESHVPDRQTLFNAFEGARLSHRLDDAVPVVASGGVVDSRMQSVPESEIIRDLLVGAGVPPARIIADPASRTTHEQALNVARIIAAHQWQHVFLVAPAVQMPRAVASFAQAGASVIPADAPFGPAPPESDRLSWWMPNGEALGVSARAAYDYLAWLYYWARGWL